MVCTTCLWWLGGWLTIVLPTLVQSPTNLVGLKTKHRCGNPTMKVDQFQKETVVFAHICVNLLWANQLASITMFYHFSHEHTQASHGWFKDNIPIISSIFTFLIANTPWLAYKAIGIYHAIINQCLIHVHIYIKYTYIHKYINTNI